jgi:hypothetical protein
MINFYSNGVPPYSGKIYKFLNIENIFFLNFWPKKNFKTHNVFDGILGGLYSKNTVFSGKSSL